MLCYLSASISLMQLLIGKRLDIWELKPTIVTLQLADISIKYPSRILENAIIRMGRL